MKADALLTFIVKEPLNQRVMTFRAVEDGNFVAVFPAVVVVWPLCVEVAPIPVTVVPSIAFATVVCNVVGVVVEVVVVLDDVLVVNGIACEELVVSC